MVIICDCKTHMIVGVHAPRGPKPDNSQLAPTLKNTIIKLDKLLGDAGFDGEPNHNLCRNEKNIRSFFPATMGPPTTKPPKGYWRRKMKNYFTNPKYHHYGQRWQVETAFSMIIRCFTSSLSARSHKGRMRQLFLLALTHNIAIFLIEAFLRSMSVPYFLLSRFHCLVYFVRIK